MHLGVYKFSSSFDCENLIDNEFLFFEKVFWFLFVICDIIFYRSLESGFFCLSLQNYDK